MVEKTDHSIIIALNVFKLHLCVRSNVDFTLHFNSPSRRFYLSLIALVVHEMKKRGEIVSIPLKNHHQVLALLNETVGGSAGSSKKEQLLSRIYRKWKDALPDLENAPLFKIVGRKKRNTNALGSAYGISENAKDSWANLFEYKGSHDHLRLRFSIDRLGIGLDDVTIIFGAPSEAALSSGWEDFIASLQAEKQDNFALKGIGDNGISDQQLELTNKPSVAVLPFVNMSHDPEQEYFCDGLTDEIITVLSKNPLLSVIARNSTFTYKGKPTKIQQVGRELGVRYVLEGSVKRSGDRIRINTQFIDTVTGHHLWVERYNRTMKDLFVLQDDITMKIQIALRVKLTDGAGARQRARGTANFEAYEKNLHARKYFLHGTKEGNVLARQLGEEAIALDPKYAYAYIYPGWTHAKDAFLGWSKSPRKSIQVAFDFAQKALALDDSLAITHNLLGFLFLLKNQHEKAIAESEKAIALSPDAAGPRAHLGIVLQYAGRPTEAIDSLNKAIRLNPIPPCYYHTFLGQAYGLTGQYEEAIREYKKALDLEPDDHFAKVGMTITCSLSGQEDKARVHAAEVLLADPKFTIDRFAKHLPFRDQTKIERIINALCKAGLP